MTHRVHNARLIRCAPYRVGAGQRFVLTFEGNSDVVLDMSGDAIGLLKWGLPEVCPCCHRVVEKPISRTNEIEPDGVWEPWETFRGHEGKLPINEPPCRHCRFWSPRSGKNWIGVEICVTPDLPCKDFSCYRPKDGTE